MAAYTLANSSDWEAHHVQASQAVGVPRIRDGSNLRSRSGPTVAVRVQTLYPLASPHQTERLIGCHILNEPLLETFCTVSLRAKGHGKAVTVQSADRRSSFKMKMRSQICWSHDSSRLSHVLVAGSSAPCILRVILGRASGFFSDSQSSEAPHGRDAVLGGADHAKSEVDHYVAGANKISNLMEQIYEISEV